MKLGLTSEAREEMGDPPKSIQKGCGRKQKKLPTQGYKLTKNCQGTFLLGEREPLKGQSKNPVYNSSSRAHKLVESIKLSFSN